MACRSAVHDHRHPHAEDDSYRDHQDRDAHRNVGNRMIHRFLLNQSVSRQGGTRTADRPPLWHCLGPQQVRHRAEPSQGDDADRNASMSADAECRVVGDYKKSRSSEGPKACTPGMMPPTSVPGIGTVLGGFPAVVTVTVMGWTGARTPPKGMLSDCTPDTDPGSGTDTVCWP